MLEEAIDKFYATRDFSNQAFRSACYAPFTNLYFDQWGAVKTCCWSGNYDVGDIRSESIDEIWQGKRLQKLRAALTVDDFSLGCALCAEQLDRGWFNSANMKSFDRYPVKVNAPEWPARVELSISNSCNLQCIMCNGDFSTAIRTHRENRPPRPRIYPENFTDQLFKYIPHLRLLKFMGGEPFLVTEYYDIWRAMIYESTDTLCHVTTNGTISNAKVDFVLERLRFAFAISLDGATKETAEAIRVGLNFDEQFRFIKRIRNYTRDIKTNLTLVYCFMRQNWHELGLFCQLCDDLDCDAYVNTVNYPPQFGVYNLPDDQLIRIRRGMEAEAYRIGSSLTRNKHVWFCELDRVTATVNRRIKSAPPPQF